MSQNMPETIQDLLDWCETHVDLWDTNAAAVGLQPSQALNFKSLNTTLRETYDAAQAAREASKNATLQLQAAVSNIRSTGNVYINIIKGYATTTGNMDVYALGGISPKNDPSTLPPPVAPTNFGATINTDGSLTIKWKASQPAGVTNVVYMVYRRVNATASTPFTLISSEGRNKSFTDMTLPLGVDRVEYVVQPKRGEITGPQSNVFALQFGTVPDGLGVNHMSIMNVTERTSSVGAKLAA